MQNFMPNTNLLNTLARKTREKFFARLDAEWGRGFQYRTHPDRAPDPRKATAPPLRAFSPVSVQYRNATGEWENLWRTEWLELALAYRDTLRADGFVSRLRNSHPIESSKYCSARIADLVSAYREGCENQTLVKRAADIKHATVYRSVRLLPHIEQSSEVIIYTGTEPTELAPCLKTPEPTVEAPEAPKAPIALQETLFDGKPEPIW